MNLHKRQRCRVYSHLQAGEVQLAGLCCPFVGTVAVHELTHHASHLRVIHLPREIQVDHQLLPGL